MGLMEDNAKATQDAREDVKKALQQLEEILKSSKYLIGDFVSLADIVLVCALREGFQRVFDAAFRKPFPKVTAWFEACCAMPQFKAVFPAVSLCTKAATPVAVKKEFLPPARNEGQKAASQEAASAKKSEAKPAAKPSAKPAAKPAAAPAAAPAVAPAAAQVAASGDVEAQVTAVGDEIRMLKEKLKVEGLSGKKINDHDQIKALVAKLTKLKAGLPAGGALAPAALAAPSPAPAPAPAAPPAAAAAAGGDIEAQVKTVGDELRVLKEKLKGDGLSGKKVNDHTEVKVLVAKLTELKAKL